MRAKMFTLKKENKWFIAACMIAQESVSIR